MVTAEGNSGRTSLYIVAMAAPKCVCVKCFLSMHLWLRIDTGVCPAADPRHVKEGGSL